METDFGGRVGGNFVPVSAMFGGTETSRASNGFLLDGRIGYHTQNRLAAMFEVMIERNRSHAQPKK